MVSEAIGENNRRRRCRRTPGRSMNVNVGSRSLAARIVEAADEARRQLERDPHDGAQQHLVLAALTLKCAQAQARGTCRSRRIEALAQLQRALDELRDLARGDPSGRAERSRSRRRSMTPSFAHRWPWSCVPPASERRPGGGCAVLHGRRSAHQHRQAFRRDAGDWSMSASTTARSWPPWPTTASEGRTRPQALACAASATGWTRWAARCRSTALVAAARRSFAPVSCRNHTQPPPRYTARA